MTLLPLVSVETTATQVTQLLHNPRLVRLIKSWSPIPQVFVAFLPSHEPKQVIEAVSIVSNLGLKPVPHLPANRFDSPSHLQAFLNEMKRACPNKDPFDSCLLVGGARNLKYKSPTRTGHPHEKSDMTPLEVIQSGVLTESGITNIGLPGHPEGIKGVAEEDLESTLQYKVTQALSTGSSVFIVSQFSCDSSPFLETWAKSMKQQLTGSSQYVPIRMGVVGPISNTQLAAIARTTNVEPPTDESPSCEIISPLWDTPRNQSSFDAAHLFTFGGLERALEFIQQRKASPASVGSQ